MIVGGIMAAIATLSPITSQKYWNNFREMSGISEASFMPMSDLPFRVMRSPAFANAKLDTQYTSVKKIELDNFFGFELKTLPDKDLFKLVLDQKEYTVRLKSLEKKGENYFTWVGNLDDNDNHLLVLTYLNGYAGANINGPSGVYTIQFEHGRHMLKKYETQ